jgi:hypothetical protein
MKTQFQFIKLVFTGIVTFFIAGNLPAQELDQIKSIVESRHYVFVAQTAQPMRGGTRQLTSGYELRVAGDTITSYLPYFGRAYVAPFDPSEGGIKFTAVKANYQMKPARNGGWNIQIKPADAGDVRQLTLSISSKGFASLQVISTNRQDISFNGYIKTIETP